MPGLGEDLTTIKMSLLIYGLISNYTGTQFNINMCDEEKPKEMTAGTYLLLEPFPAETWRKSLRCSAMCGDIS